MIWLLINSNFCIHYFTYTEIYLYKILCGRSLQEMSVCKMILTIKWNTLWLLIDMTCNLKYYVIEQTSFCAILHWAKVRLWFMCGLIDVLSVKLFKWCDVCVTLNGSICDRVSVKSLPHYLLSIYVIDI